MILASPSRADNKATIGSTRRTQTFVVPSDSDFDSESDSKSSHGNNPAKRAWAHYDAKWKALTKYSIETEVPMQGQIPWPVSSGRLDDVNEAEVRAFFMDSATNLKPEPKIGPMLLEECHRWQRSHLKDTFGRRIFKGVYGPTLKMIRGVAQQCSHEFYEERIKLSWAYIFKMKKQRNCKDDPNTKHKHEEEEEEEAASCSSSSDKHGTEEKVPTLDTLLTKLPTDDSTKIPLECPNTYWSAPESFHELVQNWTNSIIKIHGLQETTSTVTRQERHEKGLTEIVYKVPDPHSHSSNCLGYIWYTCKDSDEDGTVEIVTRHAILRPENLAYGRSNKAGNIRNALRNLGTQYPVSCQSGGLDWNFTLGGQGKLICRDSKMSPVRIHKLRRTAYLMAKTTLLPFAPNPHNDIRFVIGNPNLVGEKTCRKVGCDKITPKEFELWCQSPIFLQHVKEHGKIKTEIGDLLLDRNSRGKLYFKDTLLSETTKRDHASRTEKRFRYGYNFLDCTFDAGRVHLSSPEEECEAILSIWDLALKQQPHCVKLLSEMLNDWRWADVELAKKFIKKDTVIRLRDYLFEDKSKWYFSTSERQDAKLYYTIQSLGREGAELQDSYWSILEAHDMIHKAVSEQYRRFVAADIVALNTNFAQQIDKILQACIYACSATQKIRVIFVEGGSLPLQVLYIEDKDIFRVHEKWLDQTEAAQELGLLDPTAIGDLIHHISNTLFEKVINSVPLDRFTGDNGRSYDWHRGQQLHLAEQRIIEPSADPSYTEHLT
ncbi:hypothetical protein FSARC_12550 [Fusarium sarcochroum]|uniref:Uncharacterized protein n=1 Tax=Fusarium sarcochroum TaxID=1208366 RepID=A0A8H4WWF3_9HYPO|nr:hypothetical protein FSARC_12550 [Fusarium sarcochroum]